MSNKLRLRFIFIFFQFFIFQCSYSQINSAFVKYLSERNLRREHFAYLFQCENLPPTDSINLFKAKYYLQYFDDSLFIQHYLNNKTFFIADTNAVTWANILLLTSEPSKQALWYNSYSEEQLTVKNRRIRNTYLASLNPTDIDDTQLPDNLRYDFAVYKKSYSKNPYVGAMLSLVVPGLGKMYAGKKRSFYTTLLMHLISGAESYESINKLGIKHPFTLFSLSFFSVFYVANVYGSFNDVIQVKKQARNQFLINAEQYYKFNYMDTISQY